MRKKAKAKAKSKEKAAAAEAEVVEAALEESEKSSGRSVLEPGSESDGTSEDKRAWEGSLKRALYSRLMLLKASKCQKDERIKE